MTTSVAEKINQIERPDGTLLEHYYIESDDPFEGVAIASVLGGIELASQVNRGPLVRLHSACVYGETLGSTDCDCGPQLHGAWQRIEQAGVGILFYLRQEGRGARVDEDGNLLFPGLSDPGLATKAQAYQAKDLEGLDTAAAYKKRRVPFDQRRYGHCGRFLLEHGIYDVRLMTNNPRKIEGIRWPDGFEGDRIHIEREEHFYGFTDQNEGYLAVKREQGHMLPKNLKLYIPNKTLPAEEHTTLAGGDVE